MNRKKQVYSSPETDILALATLSPIMEASLGGNNNEDPEPGDPIGDDE